MGQLIRPLVHTIAARTKNQDYNREILSQTIPKLVAHTNLGNIQHVQALRKTIQNDRYDHLMDIVKSNQKPASFSQAPPNYPQYPSLTVLVNGTVKVVDKVLTHRLLALHRANHAYLSRVIQKLRNLWVTQHHSTHTHVQTIYTDLQEALGFVKQLDKFILYGLLVTAILSIISVFMALCICRKCIMKDIKSHNKTRESKTTSLAMSNLKQAAPLLPSTSPTPTYSLVLQNPSDRSMAVRGTR